MSQLTESQKQRRRCLSPTIDRKDVAKQAEKEFDRIIQSLEECPTLEQKAAELTIQLEKVVYSKMKLEKKYHSVQYALIDSIMDIEMKKEKLKKLEVLEPL